MSLRLFCLALVGSVLGWNSLAGTLIPPDAQWRFFRGYSEASSPDSSAWREVAFSDAAWESGFAGLYFENQPASPNAVTGNTLLNDMFGNYTSVFMRREFVLTNIYDISSLSLAGWSDDGFIAWINGQEVGRFNMPQGDVAFNRTSLPALGEPIPWWTSVVSNPHFFLHAGTNVLAVHAFNASVASSSDFVINPDLYFDADTTAPAIDTAYPTPTSLVRQLDAIEIVFSEPVTGINATDLRINGVAATNLVEMTKSQWVFQFPQPATGAVSITWAPGHGIKDLTTAGNPLSPYNWAYTLDPNAPVEGVIISEFLADNSGDQPNSVVDELDNSPDWIEIHNRSTSPVSLTGWSLTDEASDLDKWRFPTTLLPAGGYLVVMASGRNTNVAGQLHTNFKISAGGGVLALVDPSGSVVSAFPTYPAQSEDVSYGRDRLDPTLVGFFLSPTPGGPNSAPGEGVAPEVGFSRVSGLFVTNFSLELSVPNPNCDIRYVVVTTNVPSGSLAPTNIPTANSPLYTGPIAISTSTQVRARAFPRSVNALPGPPRSETFLKISTAMHVFSSDLPAMILYNFAGGTVPASTDQTVIAMLFEPVNGRTSFTNPPTMVSRAGLNIRGRSTAGLPQSSFALEFWDEYNDDKDRSLVGLPEESDWVLFAQNQYDTSYLHNPLAHQLSRDLGRYSSRTRYLEVFLNISGGIVSYASPAGGNYQGLYTIEEKVKRNQNRVDIEELQLNHTNAPLVTGGYLLKIDQPDPNERTFYDSALQGDIVYQEPPGLEMVSPARLAQANYIRNYFTQFGTALWGANYTNSATGYRAYIDVGSWIDSHIINCFTYNVDAYRLSGYFFKDRSHGIEMGPMWDFDRSLGTSGDGDLRPFNPRAWRVQAGGDQGTDFFGNPSLLGVRWWQRLFQDPDFWQAWIDRWTELRGSVLSTNHLFALTDAFGNQVRNAQTRQAARWSYTAARGGAVSYQGYYYPFPGTYQGEINFLKQWLADRVNFIGTNFLRAPVFSQPGGNITNGFVLTVSPSATLPGTVTYYTLDGTDPRTRGGGLAAGVRSNTGTLYLTLVNNARVFARNFNPSHANATNYPGSVGGNPPISSSWSGPAIGTFVINTPKLVISEIMYHPAAPATGTNSAGDFEFIELKNSGATTINLVGFRFTNGISFTFTATNSITQLAAGQYLVLVRNRAAFLTRYPALNNIAGEYTGSLENSGERLALLGSLGEPIHDFSFGDSWYPVTDGLGFSLVIRNESGALDTWPNSASWRASTAVGGSPGGPDPAPANIPAVVVTEALTHTDPPQIDTIELYNPTASPAPIGGWFLTDDPEEPFKYAISSNVVINPGNYVTFTQEQFGAGADGFALDSTGDEVYLFSAAGGNLTGYRHGFKFGAQINGNSFGRVVTSEGKEHFIRQTDLSLGGANLGPKIGPAVISEIHFAPPAFGSSANNLEEFVEVHNASYEPVLLFDPNHATNTWKLGGGIEFTFPEGVVLPGLGHGVVVNFDPLCDPVALNWFRARFNLGTDVSIFGPFGGQLANEGDRVSLYQPDRPQVAPAPDAGFVPYVLADQVDFLPGSPWPTGTLETGKSMARKDAAAFGNEPLNWIAADPSPGRANPGAIVADRDLDGLPDAWELANGFDPLNSGGSQGASGDPDGDGSSNWDEYIAGTDPNNPADALKIVALTISDQTLSFQFPTKLDRTYEVQRLDTMGGANVWVPWLLNRKGTGQMYQVIDPVDSSSRYYRIKVTPPF